MDPLRDWVFLSDEQMEEFFGGETPAEIQASMDKFVPIKDVTTDSKNPYMQDIQSWRKVLGLKNENKYEGVREEYGEHAGIDLYSVSRGFRRTREEYGKGWGASHDLKHSVPEGNYDGYSDEEIRDFLRAYDPENTYLVDELLPDLIKDLVLAQKVAAKEAGYKQKYGADQWFEHNIYGDVEPGFKLPTQDIHGNPIFWVTIFPSEK